jgi:hypothetical protein
MRIPSFLLALLVIQFALAQERFPALNGTTADGLSVPIPLPVPKNYTVVGMAYGRKSQPQLEEWYEPVYLRFVAKHGLFAGQYDVDVRFLPLFVGLDRAAYEPSMKKFRKSAAPEVVDLVVFVKADAEMLQQQLGMTDKDIPYIFILDKQGRIVHRTQGNFTDEKLEAMEEIFLR